MKHYPVGRYLAICLLAFSFMFVAGSCDDGTGLDPLAPTQPAAAPLIDPGNANQLSQVLITPAGAQTMQGAPPAPTGGTAAPRVSNPVTELNSSNGSTATLPFQYNNVSGNLRGCYAQVVGSSQYYNIPYPGTSGATGNLSLPLGIPTNVDGGRFQVAFCVYDASGRVSNVVILTVNVLRLGTGALQISLSWSTPTDQDLHVTDPTGNEIYFASPSSPSGGELDRDDQDGYGPENIFWKDSAPDGTYRVSVEDYDNTSTANPIVVTVNSPGKSKTFTGQTIRGNTVQVVTITKSGNTYTY